MTMKPGTRLHSAVSGATVVVVRPADAGDILCGGHLMTVEPPSELAASADEAEILIGKRYFDAESGLELLCVKAGAGSLSIGDRVLLMRAAKNMPSSD